MGCEDYLEWMSAALDGELTGEERRALDAHLAACPRCAALFEELSAQSAALRSLDCEAPAGLRERILAGLPGQEVPGRRAKLVRWRRWSSVAACLLLAVGVFALTRLDMPANSNGSTSPGENAAPQMEDMPYDAYTVDPRAASPAEGLSGAQYLRVTWTDSWMEVAGSTEDRSNYPAAQKADGTAARLVTSEEELENLLAEFPEDDLTELLADYDAAYFETGRLIAVVVTENSGSVTHTVESVEPDGDGYSITIRRTVPEEVTCDMAAWLILIETGHEFDGGESLNVVISN